MTIYFNLRIYFRRFFCYKKQIFVRFFCDFLLTFENLFDIIPLNRTVVRNECSIYSNYSFILGGKMQKREISLIYPSSVSQENYFHPNISEDVLEELGLNSILELKNSRLCDFFTTDKTVIEYRQEVFKDLLENEELCNLLVKVNPILSDISELRRLSIDNETSDTYDSKRESLRKNERNKSI